jgi:hypothetical protein
MLGWLSFLIRRPNYHFAEDTDSEIVWNIAGPVNECVKSLKPTGLAE